MYTTDELQAASQFKTLERKKRFRNKNRQDLVKKQRAYNSKNQERITEKQKVYNIKNKEILKQKRKVYNQKNQQVINQKQQEYRETYCNKRKSRNQILNEMPWSEAAELELLRYKPKYTVNVLP